MLRQNYFLKILFIAHSAPMMHAATSSFGELLIAQPRPIVQLNFTYNINPDYMKVVTTGTGSATQSNNMLLLQTGERSSSSAMLTSIIPLYHQPGQGSTCLFSSIYTTGVTGNSQIAGIGNNTNGFFFGFNGTTFGILYRNNSVDSWIPQSQWNNDSYDGRGPSNITLNPTMGNIFKIQYQWLGFGNINFFIENPSTGNFTLVHQIQYANAQRSISLTNPSLTLMSQVINTTNSSNISLQIGSISGFIEGIINTPTIRQSTLSPLTTITSQKNLLTIYNKPTYQSVSNQNSIYPDFVTFFNSTSSTSPAVFTLYLNPTVGGTPTFTDINTNASTVSYDTAGNTITGGTPLYSFFVSIGNFIVLNLAQYMISLNPGDKLVFAGTPQTTSSSVRVAVSWRETV